MGVHFFRQHCPVFKGEFDPLKGVDFEIRKLFRKIQFKRKISAWVPNRVFFIINLEALYVYMSRQHCPVFKQQFDPLKGVNFEIRKLFRKIQI